MNKMLLKIARSIKNTIIEERNNKVPNTKTGISEKDRIRLLSYPFLTEGVIDFFGNPFYFPDSLAFLHSLDEIFKEEIYKFDCENSQPYIIDCGANMGLSIFYLKKQYPNAKILAFEPDNSIFKILEKNIKQLPNNSNIELREEAVWTNEGELSFYSEGTLGGSTQVDFRNNNNVIRVKSADLKKYLNEKVDFLKIDIEGAENELIFDIKHLLVNVDKLFLEYHGLKNKKQNLGDILNLLTECGFEYYIRLAGETMKYPFCNEEPTVFNQQLNIMCYRLKS